LYTLELALAESNKISGKDSNSSTKIIEEMMNVHYKMAQFVKAIELGKDMILPITTKYGPNSKELGNLYVHIGEIYSKKREAKTGIEYYNKALDIFMK